MGVISKTTPNPHSKFHASLHHRVFFNSPHYAALHGWQTSKQVAKLERDHLAGCISDAQLHTGVGFAAGHHVYVSGGLAVLMHWDIINKVQVHQVHCMSKSGGLKRSK